MAVEVAPHSTCLATTTDKNTHELRDSELRCDEFQGISLEPKDEIIGVANIPNEACTTVAIGITEKTSFIEPTPAYQDLLEYLARPRLILSGSVPTTRGLVLSRYINWTNLQVWFPGIQTRLAGVQGIRFKTKFTLTVASTPFQQGLLASSFQYGVENGDLTVYPRCNNSAFVTNLPHVLHDLAETTMSILDVPFLYTFEFMQIFGGAGSVVSTGGDMGVYALNVIMPYRVIAGVNAPTYKLMVSLHDVELVGSTALGGPGILIPQAGKAGKRANPIVKEEETVRGSDTVLALSTKIRTISSYIPFLSSIGSTTSNVLDVGANIAKVFGYAKPPLTEPPNRMFPTPFIGEGNVDMDDASFVLAPFQSNRVAVDSTVGGTDVDEMALQYVIGKYGQIFSGTFANTDVTGTPLYVTQVCPTNFWFRTNTGRPGGNFPLPAGATATTNSIAMSPLAYTASFFRYWRGTMTFRFTFSKTKFHGGRVIAGFIPYFEDSTANNVLSLTAPSMEVLGGLPQPFSYCEIFDLRDASTFELKVPYISPTPFSSVQGSIGGVSMFVLDPLITAGEISSTVDYLVEVKAEDDFEFSCPAPPMFSLATPNPNSTAVAFYQSGDGGIKQVHEPVSQYTTGECILSFKQLMMLPTYITGDVANLSINNTNLFPFWVGNKFTMATPFPNGTTAVFAFTRSATIAAMYAFATGSTTHHVYMFNPGANGLEMNIGAIAVDNGVAASSPGDPRTRGTSGAQRVITIKDSLHVRVPSYQRTTRVPVSEFGNVTFGLGTVPNAGSNCIANIARLSVNNTTGATVRIIYGRAAGDDARCTTYVGPPPVALLQGTQTAQPDSPGVAFLS